MDVRSTQTKRAHTESSDSAQLPIEPSPPVILNPAAMDILTKLLERLDENLIAGIPAQSLLASCLG
jgi:hypothetical protein